MKHITYTQKEPLTSTYNRAGDFANKERKNATIFHNVIAINASYLSIEEFKNSFNDIDDPDYLEPEYKEMVAQTYLHNQREFHNEDLMYFDRELLNFEKTLVTKYTKNEEMLNLLVQDEDFIIREILASRKDLPDYIVDKLVADPVASIRDTVIVSGNPLSKEQLKLFVKETDLNVIATLFKNKGTIIINDSDLIDYFVKNGSLTVKEVLCENRPSLTYEQIEHLTKSQNSNLKTKYILARFYKLPETVINYWLSLKEPELSHAIASRGDLTKSMVDIIIAKNKYTFNIDLIYNNNLFENSPEIYQYAMSSALLNSDRDTITQTLYYYIRNLNKLKFKLSSDVLQHLVEVNYKKGDIKLADYILQIPNIPQFTVERIAFDSVINYLSKVNFRGIKEYYTVGANTKYFKLVLKIKDYVQKAGYVQPIPSF